jgi:inner membrane transporter RhtA
MDPMAAPTAHSDRAPARALPAVPPTVLVLLSILSVQLGAAVAKNLFGSLGVGGVTFLRLGVAAVVLLTLWRPTLRGYAPRHLMYALLFGLSVAAMNFAFYGAMSRIPLGIAVTVEFVGPLGVAVAGSRRALDGVWVVLAGAGIALLAPWGGVSIDGLGILLGLLAGVFWAAYILLSAQVGRVFPGGSGIALGMGAGAIAMLPISIVTAGTQLVQPPLLAGGAAVAVLSAVIPYSLDVQALRSIPTRIFGVMMSLAPAMAALVGFVALGQVLGLRAIVAIFFVSAASIGASRAQRG